MTEPTCFICAARGYVVTRAEHANGHVRRCPATYGRGLTLAGRPIGCDLRAGHDGAHGNSFAARYWQDDDRPAHAVDAVKPTTAEPTTAEPETLAVRYCTTETCADARCPNYRPRGQNGMVTR